MSPLYDLIVVGGGSAGSAVARATAQAGLGTVLLEKGSLDDAGAGWVNGVHGRSFDEAGVARPEAPERRATRPLVGVSDHGPHHFHLVAGWGPDRLSFTDTGVLEVDMRLLNRRLRKDAAEAGAELRSNTRVISLDDRKNGALKTSRGDLRARVIVDATGLGGFFRPDKPRPADICAAAQGVYRVQDRGAAYAWFESQRATPGDTVCFASVAGGYSIVSARLEEGEAGPELSVLTGSLPALGHPSGLALRNAFVASHAFIGPMLFGGQAPIPLHRPRLRLAFTAGSTTVVRVGDAAGLVYAAHGSGIGAQLIAARMLAEDLSTHGPSGAFRFQGRWHRRFLAEFVAADTFRRLSAKLDGRTLGFLMRRGLMPKALVARGFLAGLV